MRITIDALPLLFRSAGVKNYLYYWIRYLQREPRAEVSLFPFLGEAAGLDQDPGELRDLAAVAVGNQPAQR